MGDSFWGGGRHASGRRDKQYIVIQNRKKESQGDAAECSYHADTPRFLKLVYPNRSSGWGSLESG